MTSRVLLLAVLLRAQPLSACGAYFTRGLESAVHERQEILIAFQEVDGEQYATYVVSADYSGDAEDFAWVMPISGPLVDDPIVHTDDRLFRELESRTGPSFVRQGNGGLVTGCACSAPPAAGAAGETEQLVTVVREGRAGVFDYVVLAAESSAALTSWLGDNGYGPLEDAQPYLDRYVAPEASFLALRLSDETQVGAHALRNTAAIQFTIRTDERMYPSALSQVSTAPELEVVLYTLAAERQEPTDHPAMTIFERELFPDAGNHSGTTYEDVFREKIEAGGAGTVIVEYAARWPSWFDEEVIWAEAPFGVDDTLQLTRMRTVLVTGEMDFDYTFKDSTETADVQTEFWVAHSPTANAIAASAWLAPLVGYLVLRLRRRWPGVRAGS